MNPIELQNLASGNGNTLLVVSLNDLIGLCNYMIRKEAIVDALGVITQETSPAEGSYMTREEVAMALKLKSPRTVDHMRKTGEIPASQVEVKNNRVRINRNYINQLVKIRKV